MLSGLLQRISVLLLRQGADVRRHVMAGLGRPYRNAFSQASGRARSSGGRRSRDTLRALSARLIAPCRPRMAGLLPDDMVSRSARAAAGIRRIGSGCSRDVPRL